MLVGEAQGLSTTRMRRLGAGLYRKDMCFQVRNDDGVEHFREVSRHHRAIRFVLVFADPNLDDYGSAFIEKGATRRYRLSDAAKDATMDKHQVEEDGDDDPRFWEATRELMDTAERHWIHSAGLTRICSRQRRVK